MADKTPSKEAIDEQGGVSKTFSMDMPYLELDRRYGSRREEDSDGAVTVGGDTTRDSSQKLSISTAACSAVLLVVVCFAISLAIVLLVNCVNKSICPVRRSLRKTVIASAIFLLIASTAALYLGAKVFRSLRICFKV
nr:hypothetical protein DM860_000026 [Ipomoea batatas]GMD23821.1 hypothetical protein DM860_000026 [Ipomoea batatas]GMD27106.1 hypothetical protein DM860_000026 [Ipomoea batatas]